ncbi:MAG: MCE family protein [Bacteroidetes bacterium]|jgi:phospholipid/cholesterol/gamma-HCH transport system substrate-binding protein|nr:MCE family protein [Bacteroidota bacterium]
MSNEVKVGILAVVAIAVSYWGYKFILGNNVLLKSNTYEVYYPKVGRMQVGTQVFINGVEVGSVASVDLLNDVDRTVKVVLDLKPGMTIPKDTRAVIVATGFMGGKAVMLEYDNPCSGEDCAQPGDTLEGEYLGLLNSMVGEESMGEYVGILQKGLQRVIDTLNYALLSDESDSPIANSMRNLDATLANLNSTTRQLDRMLSRSSGSIEQSLANVESITGNLKDNNAKITSILANADSLSADLVAADLQQTVADINAALAKLGQTLDSADQAVAGISGLVDGLEQGEGTLGKLMKDEQLYQDLSELSARADSLIKDLKNRPYRYIPLKSRNRINRYDRKDGRD